jgi:hypothetical protein
MPLLRRYFTVRYVPAWVPGAGFQRTAAVGRTLRDSMAGIPLRM